MERRKGKRRKVEKWEGGEVERRKVERRRGGKGKRVKEERWKRKRGKFEKRGGKRRNMCLKLRGE